MRTSTLMIYAACFARLDSMSAYGASHHIFRKHGVRELVNLQREGSKAKVYQVRQVRGVILRYGLGGEGEE